ncbi:MAG: aspartate carbamoyltransferase catalytic subunit [Tepidisphaeraceae bacterium]
MRAVHDAREVASLIDRLLDLIVHAYKPDEPLNIVGIRTRGAILADRLVVRLRQKGYSKIDHGVVDIALHRDDVGLRGPRPLVRTSQLQIDLDGKPLLLVDDVLFTGRSMRAALDAVTEFGRPSSTRIAVLIDRGGREFPIQADYIAQLYADVPADHRVNVRFTELDARDEILIAPSLEQEVKQRATEGTWKHRHLLGLEELSAEEITFILDTAKTFAEVSTRSVKKVPALRGRVIVNAFFEDSTRTRMSFSLAASRLSADVVDFSEKGSSVSKGETLVDTARNIEAMGVDAMVVRHQASGAALQLSRTVKCSVINAGDGAHEHPTQGLLDLYTIRERFGGNLRGLNVAIVGDIANSRVARSDLWGLTKLGAHVHLVGPPTLLPKSFEKLTPGVTVTHDFDSIVGKMDVINMLRVQNERMKSAQFPTVREFTKLFGLTWDRFARCKKDVLVMHPGPMNRGVEIHNEIADGPNSAILKQVEHGLAVRMAVLYLVMQERA